MSIDKGEKNKSGISSIWAVYEKPMKDGYTVAPVDDNQDESVFQGSIEECQKYVYAHTHVEEDEAEKKKIEMYRSLCDGDEWEGVNRAYLNSDEVPWCPFFLGDQYLEDWVYRKIVRYYIIKWNDTGKYEIRTEKDLVGCEYIISFHSRKNAEKYYQNVTSPKWIQLLKESDNGDGSPYKEKGAQALADEILKRWNSGNYGIKMGVNDQYALGMTAIKDMLCDLGLEVE